MVLKLYNLIYYYNLYFSLKKLDFALFFLIHCGWNEERRESITNDANELGIRKLHQQHISTV